MQILYNLLRTIELKDLISRYEDTVLECCPTFFLVVNK